MTDRKTAREKIVWENDMGKRQTDNERKEGRTDRQKRQREERRIKPLDGNTEIALE